MVSLSTPAGEATKAADPEYQACSESGEWATTRPETVHVAVPPLSVTVSSLLQHVSTVRDDSSLIEKVTVPAGVPPAGAAAPTPWR